MNLNMVRRKRNLSITGDYWCCFSNNEFTGSTGGRNGEYRSLKFLRGDLNEGFIQGPPDLLILPGEVL